MSTDAFLQRFEAGDLGDAPCSGSIETPWRLSRQKPNANSASFPHRLHEGETGVVQAHAPVDAFAVLSEIEKQLSVE